MVPNKVKAKEWAWAEHHRVQETQEKKEGVRRPVGWAVVINHKSPQRGSSDAG
jgi:hypothetical protein